MDNMQGLAGGGGGGSGDGGGCWGWRSPHNGLPRSRAPCLGKSMALTGLCPPPTHLCNPIAMVTGEDCGHGRMEMELCSSRLF